MLERTGIWYKLLGIAIGGTYAFSINCAIAQITPDKTLTNNSSVSQTANIINITGGTQAGRNLFHSFQSFSVPTRATAFFNNGLDINNIISRVTGGSISNIDGLIQTRGTANLFLINPTGIVFGRNASLNVGGSFIASTASSLKFADGFVFSATAPLSTAPLLTISLPTGLQFGSSPGEILLQGSGAVRNPDFQALLLNKDAGLRVQPDKTLALVGGQVTLDGGVLNTDGGRIELGSVAGNGLVSLTPINKGFSLGYTGVQSFGNINLSQQAAVNTSGGDIQVWGKNLSLTNGSQIETITLGSQPGGSLVVNAQESVQVTGVNSNPMFPSALRAETAPNTQGPGGNVTINTGKFLVQDGGFISASTYGAGKSGDLIINASDSVQVTGTTGNFGSALLVQQNQANAKGSAGNLKINTHQLLLADGAFIGTGTLGIANGGFLTINADSVDIINGINPNKTTGISSQAEEGSRGNAGNLTINTHDLRIKDGAFVTSSTKSVGNAGNLTINATGSVQLIGTNPNGTISTLLAQSQDKATGAPGNLTINTNQLLVQDGAFVGAGISSLSPTKSKSAGNLTINASDFVHVIGTSPNGSNSSGLSTQAEAGATGASGNLTINTHELLVRDGAFVSASTKGSGNGGNLNIKADSVQVIGTFAKGKGSSLLVQAEPGSSGNAGDLTINTGELLVQGGAFVGTGTFGKGNGGNLTVSGNLTAKADSVKIIGTFADTNSSGLSTQAEQGSLGNAGNLIINTRELLVQGGGFVSSGTKSSGNGGDLNIKADSVKIIGTSPNRTTTSSILTEAQAGSSGNAGNLIIDTRDLVVRGNPTIKTTESRGVVGILVRSLGTGNAGNLTINARSILLDSNAALTGDTNKEKATITLHSRDYLILTRGGSITTDARGSNVIGGNTNINTDTLAAVNSVISASSRDSRGGQVTINAQSIFRSNDTEITATGASPQLNGTVQINTLNIDPSRGLVILPTISEVTPKLISSRCQAFNEAQGGSQFILTGRGGLPTSPYEPLTSDAIWTDSRIPATTIRQYLPKKVRVRPIIKRKPITINPATGWVFNGNGEVTLISSTRNVTGSASTPASCPRP